MKCRSQCGACCIVPSISSAIPGMPNGKPANVRCVNLTEDYQCAIFKHPKRPEVCGMFTPEKEFCGDSKEEAFCILNELLK